MTRRRFIETAAAAGAGLAFQQALRARDAADAGIAAKASMGVNLYSFHYRQIKSAYQFLEYLHGLGAAGMQTQLDSLDAAYISKLRRRAEELGMYLEVIAELPHQDTTKFEATVGAASSAGALCLRTACLSGRRYENFTGLEDWKRFVADSKARIALAAPIVEEHRLPMAIENHKDWTADELAALLKGYSSEYVGACVDTGNNIALLDDPLEVVGKLAPYAAATHFKDMAVAEYADGFLLAEVPLGEGFLDLERMATTIRRARPQTKLTLEMITRNPLKVPCLTDRYWATFPDRNGDRLARTLRLVREHPSRQPLAKPDSLDPAARVEAEESNVKKCLEYARRLNPRSSAMLT